MKIYIQPIVKCHEVKLQNIMGQTSVPKKTDEPADKNYTGGGDAKTSNFTDFDEDDDE